MLYWMAQMWSSKSVDFTPEDFHPRMLIEKKRREEELARQAADVLKSLPKSRTEKEIEAQWRAIQDASGFPKG